MLFNTWDFGIFLAPVLFIYLGLARRAQNVWLLAVSLLFYSFWDWRLCGLLVGAALLAYWVGLRLEASQGPARKRWLVLGLVINLATLSFFKYFNFFLQSAAELLQRVGFDAHPAVLKILLPVGISFYLFQTIAYLLDVYRGQLKASNNLIEFTLFVSYFPHLVAGPIQRPRHLLKQFSEERTVTLEKMASGVVLFLVGLLRKTLADAVASSVDHVFSSIGTSSSLMLLGGAFLFGLQVYGDFAGYTDMARGVSRLFGIELSDNFKHPYFSTDITEFWKRWHISLSSWLRDYLYLPLVFHFLRKYRNSKWPFYLSLFLTMLLGGLWHGASWNYVAWGAVHGAALVVHGLWTAWREKREPSPEPRGARRLAGQVAAWSLTMMVVLLGFIVFRAPDLPSAGHFLVGMLSFRGAIEARLVLVPLAATALMLLIDVPQYLAKDEVVVLRWPWPARGLVYTTLVMLVLSLAEHGKAVPFVYFQF